MPKLAPMEVPQDQLAEYAGSCEAILSAAEVESSGGRLAIRRRSRARVLQTLSRAHGPASQL